MPEGDEKNTLIEMVAQYLKKAHLQWNVNSCDDDVILGHFEQLSHGQLKLQEDFKLISTKKILGTQVPKQKAHPQSQNTKRKPQNKQKK